MSDSGKAVFLSYASQDAEAAKRICEALRAAGVEVWFDQSELVGGDAWDQKIRKQIRECALLIPIISKATQGRREAYFRLEWKLADERTHLMAKGTPFLLPVTIDETSDRDALVPDSFLAVQWTKAPGGEGPAAFGPRVKKLLTGAGASLDDARPAADRGRRQAAPLMEKAVRPPNSRGVLLRAWISLLVVAGAVGYFVFKPKRDASETGHQPGQAQVPATKQAAANPGSKPEVAVLLARVRAATGKIDLLRTELDTMEGLLDQAAKLDPADAAIWAQWAQLDCLFLDKRYDHTPARRDAARRHVAQAAGLDAEAPAVRLAQAMVMRRLADDAATTAEATKILQRLLTEIPADGRVPLELGWLTFDLVRPEASLDWFARAAQVPGYGGPGHFARARMLVYSARTDQAGPEFDRALEAGRSAEVLLWKAYILTIWNGDVAAARRALEEVPPQFFVEDMPAATRYYVALLSRNYDQALAAARAVPHDYLQSIAYSGPTAYFAGNALALAGKTAAAELEWRSALVTVERRLAAEPNDRGLMEHKALLQAALGNRDAGRKTWQAARDLYGDADATNYAVALRVQLQTADEAFAWLERTVTAGENTATAAQLRLDPVYDPLRSDPRFSTLLAKAEADPRLSPTARLATSQKTEDRGQKTEVSAPIDQKSVAVLAFANLSDDKGNEYFSDGISEELLNVLAKIPGLKVTARTSSFFFKGKEVPIPEIAQKLGVAYVVEGSVRKAGDKVRITAQLIKAADGFHVWSDTFTRDLKDIFAVQDEIAGLIAQNLELKLGMKPAARPVNPEAHALYLQAIQGWNQRYAANRPGLVQAEATLQRAIALDPDFAPAYALLSGVTYYLGSGSSAFAADGTMQPGLAAAIAQAEQAVRLAPDSAEAHAALGLALAQAYRNGEAEAEYRRSIEAGPSYALVRARYARLLEVEGRMDEALDQMKRAVELDPLFSRAFDNYALMLTHAGRREEALAAAERSIALAPENVQAMLYKTLLLLALGRGAEADVAGLQAITRKFDVTKSPDVPGYLCAVLVGTGQRPAAEAVYARIPAELPGERIYAAVVLGRPEEARKIFAASWLPKDWMDEFQWNPLFDPLRDSAEFGAMLRRHGLVEAQARVQAWRKAHRMEEKK